MQVSSCTHHFIHQGLTPRWGARLPAQHALRPGIGRACIESIEHRPRRKMHDFGDLGRALEMVALLPEVALGR